MDWDKLKIFHAVAEAGSFTNATVNLNELLSIFPSMLEGKLSNKILVDVNK